VLDLPKKQCGASEGQHSQRRKKKEALKDAIAHIQLAEKEKNNYSKVCR
jgi:hypothetical protein